jgi:hypothetical protein
MPSVTQLVKNVAIVLRKPDTEPRVLEVPVERRRARQRLSDARVQYHGKGDVYAAPALSANGAWVVDMATHINIPE